VTLVFVGMLRKLQDNYVPGLQRFKNGAVFGPTCIHIAVICLKVQWF